MRSLFFFSKIFKLYSIGIIASLVFYVYIFSLHIYLGVLLYTYKYVLSLSFKCIGSIYICFWLYIYHVLTLFMYVLALFIKCIGSIYIMYWLYLCMLFSLHLCMYVFSLSIYVCIDKSKIPFYDTEISLNGNFFTSFVEEYAPIRNLLPM